MEFYIKKNATLPVLKMQVVKDGRSDYNKMMEMIEEASIFFSMVDTETGIPRIVTRPAGFVEKTLLDPNAEYEYYVYYQFTSSDTRKVGRYEGQFLLRNSDGTLILPIREKLYINVQESFIADDLPYESCYVVEFPCCASIPTTSTTTTTPCPSCRPCCPPTPTPLITTTTTLPTPTPTPTSTPIPCYCYIFTATGNTIPSLVYKDCNGNNREFDFGLRNPGCPYQLYQQQLNDVISFSENVLLYEYGNSTSGVCDSEPPCLQFRLYNNSRFEIPITSTYTCNGVVHEIEVNPTETVYVCSDTLPTGCGPMMLEIEFLGLCEPITTTTTIIPLETILDVNIIPGSIVIDYNFSANQYVTEELQINFTHNLGTYTGTPITIITGVTIPIGEISGSTQIILNDDFNNLSKEDSFGDITSVPPSLNWIIYENYPTPTPTPTSTPTQELINPLIVGNDEYLIVGNQEYLIFLRQS